MAPHTDIDNNPHNTNNHGTTVNTNNGANINATANEDIIGNTTTNNNRHHGNNHHQQHNHTTNNEGAIDLPTHNDDGTYTDITTDETLAQFVI